MATTVMRMVSAAATEVAGIDSLEAHRRQQGDPNLLIVDVRDFAARRESGMVAGAIPVSFGTLHFAADTKVPESWRDPRLQDRSRPVITVCDLGPMSTLAAWTLKQLGFERVTWIEGGTAAWKEAGLPMTPPPDA